MIIALGFVYARVNLDKAYHIETAVCIDLVTYYWNGKTHRAKYKWKEEGAEHIEESIATFKPKLNKECKIYVKNNDNKKIVPYSEGIFYVISAIFFSFLGVIILGSLEI